MPVFIKTCKYALATFLAIYIAQILGLDYAVSAGVIAILSLADTSKGTFIYIGNLVLTMILSLAVASLVFNLFGYHIWTFSLFLALTYPLAVYFKSHKAIAPCAVSVSHLLIEQTTSFDWLMNEFLLLIIGAGIAMVVNLYQPSVSKQMEDIKDQLEVLMQDILYTMAQHLDQGTGVDPIYGIVDLADVKLRQGIDLSQMEQANQLTQSSLYYAQYFEMRYLQLQILYNMIERLTNLNMKSQQATMLAAFLKQVADELHAENPVLGLQSQLDALVADYRSQDLPKTREEFENRAKLFEVLTDCQKFLKLKRGFVDHMRTVNRVTQHLGRH
ncbi:Uncharacterized membrane protein YgaE, UPF0421/DUF939 family [Aerococcus urinaehominis]|uniref:aromatic acid exporter family protein n=1 Tax=Aerococcus urinaehominis TaxID=128944 RepID=UPI00089154BE|nr:aromatic acid exporter family protein [Aerococcus urinaehominis]SDM09556.1 Uncharacterized membrane protein YgaE, UPF0421/DUF939 family [Aerococcus urinaehominis]